MRTSLTKLSHTLRRNPGYLIIAALALCALYSLIPKPSPTLPDHAINITTPLFSGGWLRRPEIVANGFIAFGDTLLMSTQENDRDYISAVSPSNGQILWKTELYDAARGTRALITHDNTLFTATATLLTAFDARTGYWLWSETLGNGHVGVVPTIEGDSILVYYGDNLLRVPLANHTDVTSTPLGDLLWIAGEVEIHKSAIGMFAVDTATNQLQWRTAADPFIVEELSPPRLLPPDGLLVPTTEGLCRLDLTHGGYQWCVPGTLLEAVGIDPSRSAIFALEEDFDLIRVEPSTGETEPIASFPGGILPSDTYYVYPYHLAVSPGRIFIFFGDTSQLLSLSFR